MTEKNLITSNGGALAGQQWLSPSIDLDHYIAKVRQIPVLAAEEEYALAKKYHEENDLRAAQQLVIHHLKFVVHIARSFNGYGLYLGDLIQEGNIGLMKAVKRFEPSRGVRLVSFAVHWIKSEIHEFVIKNWRLVKIATTKAQRKLFFNLRSMKKSLNWLNASEAQSIADELNVPLKDVYEMEQRINGQDMAFNAHESEEDEGYNPEMWLSDEGADPALHVESAEESDFVQQRLAEGLRSLDSRSRAIVEARWLNEGEHKVTLQHLADEYQVSAERIRQIEAQAMKQLKTYLVHG